MNHLESAYSTRQEPLRRSRHRGTRRQLLNDRSPVSRALDSPSSVKLRDFESSLTDRLSRHVRSIRANSSRNALNAEFINCIAAKSVDLSSAHSREKKTERAP